MSSVEAPVRAQQPAGPRIEPNKLEHTNTTYNTHAADVCDQEFPCSIHRRSPHPMRAFPQTWCGQHHIMERLCPHGLAHPDPDDYLVRTKQVGTTPPDPDDYQAKTPVSDATHPCDGCCTPAYLNCWTPWAKADRAWIHYRANWGIVQEGEVFHLLNRVGSYNDNTWSPAGDFTSFVYAAAATQPVEA